MILSLLMSTDLEGCNCVWDDADRALSSKSTKKSLFFSLYCVQFQKLEAAAGGCQVGKAG